MKSLSLVSLATLAVGSSASALKVRNISNDNCGRAVAGTAQGSAYMSTARADCSSNVISYTTVTITPSASTLTQPINVQSTALVTIVATNIGSTTGTSDILSTETDQYISTAYSTSLEIDTLTVPTTFTPPVVTATSVVTISTSSASTVTSYYPTAVPIAKRDLENREVENSDLQTRVVEDNEFDCELEGRAVSTIPAYASACTSWPEYVAACSVAGVPQTTSTISTTLPASTITVTASSTLISTVYETSSTEVDLSFTTFETIVVSTVQSSTLTLPLVATSIQTAYTTQTAEASTTYIYQTVTVTASSASIETVTAPVPNFKLAMVPVGGGTTLYMEVAVGDALAYKSTTDITQASVFTIDTSNRLVTTAADPEIACAYSSISNYYMEGLRHTYLDAHPQLFTALSCAVNSDLTLTCKYKTATSFTYYANQQSFFYSTANYNNFPTYVANLIPQ